MTAELVARYGPIVVGVLLVAPLVAFLASMLLEIRPSMGWATRWRSPTR